MSIKKVFEEFAAPAKRKWYDEPNDSVDESTRYNVLLERLGYRLSYLEKKVSDLEFKVKSLDVGGSKK